MGSLPSLALYLSLGVIASALLATGLFIMKSRSAVLPPAHGRGMLRAILSWIRDPLWSIGLGVQAAGYALYVAALSNAPVSLVAVMMQGGIAMFVIAAALFLRERANAREWAGIAGIFAAMVILGISLTGGAAGGAANVRGLWTFSAIAIGASIPPFMSDRLRCGGTAIAIASGVAFGLGSLYTKGLADTLAMHAGASALLGMFTHQWIYLMSAANVAGLILLQNAFHSARGIIAMPLSSAISNLMPIIGGIAAFGETLPADPVAASMRVIAFGLTVASAGLLATGGV